MWFEFQILTASKLYFFQTVGVTKNFFNVYLANGQSGDLI